MGQRHLYDPGVFRQVPPCWQTLFTHSSTSTKSYKINEFPLILQIYTIDYYESYICSKWFTSLAQCSCPALGTAAVERARPVEAGAPILTNIILNTLINIYIKKKQNKRHVK